MYAQMIPTSIDDCIDLKCEQEIREILVELLKGKDFQVTETNEYSKTKATSIVGLQDQVVNYNDPKYFAFQIKW